MSQGILSFWYSLVEDSMRKAYLPFDARTLSIPSYKQRMAERGERERWDNECCHKKPSRASTHWRTPFPKIKQGGNMF